MPTPSKKSHTSPNNPAPSQGMLRHSGIWASGALLLALQGLPTSAWAQNAGAGTGSEPVESDAPAARNLRPLVTPNNPTPANQPNPVLTGNFDQLAVESDTPKDPILTRLLGDLARRQGLSPDPEPVAVGIESSAGVPVTQFAIDLTQVTANNTSLAEPLYPEGGFLINQRGQILVDPDGQFTAFQFIDRQAPQPNTARLVVLQPNRQLENIENDMRRLASDEPALYQLSGQVHAYRGVNFMLITQARPVAPIQLPATTPENESTPTPATPGTPGDTKGEGQQTPPNTPPTTGRESPSEVLRRLLEEQAEPPAWDAIKQRVPTRTPSQAGGGSSTPGQARRPLNRNTTPGGDAATQRASRLDGNFIMARRGRLTRAIESGQATFTFAADSNQAKEAPVIVYPCRLLEKMEKQVTDRGDAVVFEVTGQLHAHRGTVYLLPTVAKLTPTRSTLLVPGR